MINPLEHFVKVDERADGVYVKITRDEKPSIRMDLICSAIDNALVMNFDRARFEDVLMRSRGAFERIGPPFEIYNPEIEKFIQLTVSSQKAIVKISSGCLLLGRKPSDKTIVYFLNSKGVTNGINTGKIQQIIDSNLWDESHEVASGTLPVKGDDARTEMLVSIDPDMQPTVKNDGSVDYRDIKTFVSVTKGQVLATKHPATAGKPGCGLGGETIAPVPGHDCKLPNGKNTELSADGLQLIASKTGILYSERGFLCIAEMLNINSDIDFNVGNVKYSGDVLINGNVCPGFSVESDGNIRIKGEVESARVVSRNGSIIVEKGIMGKGDTLINAKTGITVSFAQEAFLITDGLLTFDKFLLHCECRCECAEGLGAQASIIGGHLKAEKSINVKQIGTDKGSLTKVTLFDKRCVEIEAKISELSTLDKKLRAELEPVEKQLRTKAALLKRNEGVTERSREEVKKWIDLFNQINLKIKYVVSKIDELKNELKNPKQYDGYIFVQGTIYQGTELDLYKVKHIIPENLTKKRFRIIQSAIQTGD